MRDHANKSYLSDRPTSPMMETIYIVAIGLAFFFLIIDWS